MGAANGGEGGQGGPRMGRREFVAWLLAILGIGGLIGILITTPPAGPIRVRFFNGVNNNSPSVAVRAYVNEGDASPAKTVGWTSTQLPEWRYATDNLDDGDYKRFDLVVDGSVLKEFKVSDITGAAKLGEIFIRRLDKGGKDWSVALSYVSGGGNTPNKALTWDQP